MLLFWHTDTYLECRKKKAYAFLPVPRPSNRATGLYVTHRVLEPHDFFGACYESLVFFA